MEYISFVPPDIAHSVGSKVELMGTMLAGGAACIAFGAKNCKRLQNGQLIVSCITYFHPPHLLCSKVQPLP